MPANQPPVEAIQGEARAQEVREKVARAKASLLHLEVFAEGDDIKRVRDAIAAIALLAPSPTFADAGEVRIYREGVEDSARVCDAMHAAWREQESRYRAAGNNGPYLGAPNYHDAAAAIRKLP